MPSSPTTTHDELRAPAGLTHGERRAWASTRMSAARRERRRGLRSELRRRARGLAIAMAVFGVIAMILPAGAAAAASGSADTHTFIQLALYLGGLSLMPFAIMTLTSFLRIVVVLSFLRSGLGAQNVPPNMVIIALALFLSLFVMGPTIDEINKTAIQPAQAGKITFNVAIANAKAPLQHFMTNQMRGSGSRKEIRTFYQLALKQHGKGTNSMCPAGQTSAPVNCLPNKEQYVKYGANSLPMRVIIPAFIISELKKAFIMGFAVLLPFLVIDMVISNILLSLGMFMLPPVVISLPFKILLFVIAGGWTMVVTFLVQGFNY